ncbi:tetratricopeptide-like helical [Fusarium pseudocircinatum]|uniref:Tetratricopeptide-like helical n=1 Tax=Fusarium pseudocircinatum TaxID=56676 RepID=A0A8H5KSC2_9HYPO|nr:tetratricopeptide-like helical [Fusarium pseudocircinatum]
MPFEFEVPRELSTKEPYFDVGKYHMPITTKSSEAQGWFDRGLVWIYSFNHEEACRCFMQCIAHDPDCAMAYWGVAYAAGPNYNKTWAMFDRDDLARTYAKCHKINQVALALSKTDYISSMEKALIEALEKRYPSAEIPEDLDIANKTYADQMRDVYERYNDHLDVLALFADALMNWMPRKMFDIKTGKPLASSPVFEVRATLERGMRMPGGRGHAGIPHLYIHLMERSDEPEVALPACDIIRDLVPDAGHMYHMPTHIDVLVGEYRRSMLYNHKATLADDRYFAKHGGVNFYSFYRLHDYHSLIYACMLAGQRERALEACGRMEATITKEMLTVKSPPMADWLEFFLAVRVHVYIRFGMWGEVLGLTIPEDKELYCVTTVMIYYGKGIACASLNRLEEADTQRSLFREAAKRVPDSRLDYPNRIVDVLKVATSMLDGEIEYQRQNYGVAFEALREAIKAEDSLLYTEPWGWMVPARHPYGALSLEQGMVEQAANAYAEDLGLREGLTRGHQHPRNVWALHGYYECLKRLGRDAEAVIIKSLLKSAEAEADVPIRSSCFCRLGCLNGGNKALDGSWKD